jgi:hypothetical protein
VLVATVLQLPSRPDVLSLVFVVAFVLALLVEPPLPLPPSSATLRVGSDMASFLSRRSLAPIDPNVGTPTALTLSPATPDLFDGDPDPKGYSAAPPFVTTSGETIGLRILEPGPPVKLGPRIRPMTLDVLEFELDETAGGRRCFPELEVEFVWD